MYIYIAASFAFEDRNKTEQKKKLIEETVERIKQYLPGNYYLPHQLKIPNAWDMSLEDWSREVYEYDIGALNDADMIIFLSFGKENNAGSAWEVGYVIGQNYMWGYTRDDAPDQKKVICIKMTDEPESLMISNSVDRIITSAEIDTYDWKTFPEYKTSLGKLS